MKILNAFLRLPFMRRFDDKLDPSSIIGTDAIGADVPIHSASEDLLRRGRFANRISEILATSLVKEGRVFAIRGSWGQGKSSLKNLIIEELSNRTPVATWLDFNPWQWGDGDAIARALFAQMAGKLGGAHRPDAQKRARALRQYGGVLVGASGALKGAGDQTHGLASWLAGAAVVAGATGIGLPALPVSKIVPWLLIAIGGLALIGKLMRWLGRDRSSEPLDNVRDDLERRLAKLDRPLIVFVDDIDRLEEEQIRLIFRHIKVNANLPNIIFVLLYQPSIVERALKPVAGEEGHAYLEKIVQANFDLPALPRDKIFRIFTEQLAGIVDHLATLENGFQDVRWGNVLIGTMQPFIRNLRDVRRLLSSIAIHEPLHEGDKAFEVNIIDFLSLETLRVFEPVFHTAIAAHKSLLLQSSRFSGDRREETDKAAINDLLTYAREEHRETCKAALIELFPQVSWAFGGSHYGGESWGRTWLSEKRVCSHRSFDKYFELQIPEGTLSESAFVNLIESAGNAEALAIAIADIDAEGLLPALATRFDESVDQLPLENISVLLPQIFDLGEKVSDRTSDPFNPSFVSAWRSAVWYLRRIEGSVERSAVFLEAMRRSDALGVPATLISLDMPRDDEKEREHDPALEGKGLEAAKALWVEKIEAFSADTDALLESPELVSFLYRWRDFAGSAGGPKVWIEKVMADDERFPLLLAQFRSIGRSQSAGDRVSRRTEQYRRGDLEGFFDLESLYERVASFDRTKLAPELQKSFEQFEWHADRWREDKSTD